MSGEDITWTLPATVYPPSQESSLNVNTQQYVETVKVTEQAGLSLQVSVEMPYKIEKLESLSHQVRVKQTETKAVVELKNQNKPFDTDFILQIKIENAFEPRMWIEQNEKGSYAGMLSFCPNFQFQKDGGEYLFLIDRSSSMKVCIKEVKKVLRYFLLNLPNNSTFNIVEYGSSVKWLFQEPISSSNQSNLEFALEYIKSIKPNFGGSDLWAAIKPIYQIGACSKFGNGGIPSNLRNIFLFSDGQVTNESYVLKLIKENISHTRLFALGFGNTINRYLIKKMSIVGGGMHLFVSSSDTQIVTKVKVTFFFFHSFFFHKLIFNEIRN